MMGYDSQWKAGWWAAARKRGSDACPFPPGGSPEDVFRAMLQTILEERS